MRIKHIGLHSFVLAIVNFASVIAGFGIYHLFRPINQISLQAPVAALICIFIFVIWSVFIQNILSKGLSLKGISEFLGVYVASLLWAPALFVPIHYLSQGYLTSYDNLLAGWLFQLPVNLLAVLTVFKINKLSHANEEIAK